MEDIILCLGAWINMYFISKNLPILEVVNRLLFVHQAVIFALLFVLF